MQVVLLLETSDFKTQGGSRRALRVNKYMVGQKLRNADVN